MNYGAPLTSADGESDMDSAQAAPERRSISPKEYAQRHGVSTRTVHRWIKAGRLRIIRFNARVIRIVPRSVS